MFKGLSKREKNILLAAGAVIILAIGFKVILDPILARNESLNREIKITRLKLKKYLGLLNQKEQLKSAYAKISGAANNQQIEENASASILSEIENLAKNANLRLIDIRPESLKGPSSHSKNYVSLRAEGDMESYLKFIYNTENSLALLEIKKFWLNVKPRSSILEGNFLIAQVSVD